MESNVPLIGHFDTLSSYFKVQTYYFLFWLAEGKTCLASWPTEQVEQKHTDKKNGTV